jgi:uncharacterized protein YlxW (UPF0749 family)
MNTYTILISVIDDQQNTTVYSGEIDARLLPTLDAIKAVNAAESYGDEFLTLEESRIQQETDTYCQNNVVPSEEFAKLQGYRRPLPATILALRDEFGVLWDLGIANQSAKSRWESLSCEERLDVLRGSALEQ